MNHGRNAFGVTMSRRHKDQPPSRRDFLRHAACAAVGTTALVSTVWDLRLVNAAVTQNLGVGGKTLSDYKAMVCLFLYGGNDANNFIVPTDPTTYANYANIRANLALPNQGQAGGVLALNPTVGDGHTYGIHPSCTELQSLFNTG